MRVDRQHSDIYKIYRQGSLVKPIPKYGAPFLTLLEPSWFMIYIESYCSYSPTVKRQDLGGTCATA